MEVYILDVVVGFGRAAISRLASADVLLSMATLDGVLHAFPDVVEVVALASDMYFAISVACAAPTVPLGEDQPATLEFANAVLPTLLASVERFGSSCTQDHPDLRVTVAMTLVNASLAKIKLKEFEPVELLVHTVLAITDGNQEAGHRIIALNALKNYAVFAMLKDDVGTLEKALEFAFLNARPAIHDNYIAETLLEIIGNTMAFSQTGVRPVAPMLLAKVLDVPWPIDYLRVRQLLFGTVRNLLSSAKTELVELAIAEARANNVSPAVADFLEATWTRFDPRQPEDGPNGLITYIDVLRRAALGDALALPFASAVAEFWFFHRRTPTLANYPLPFSVLPEVDGVRIQLGEDHIGPDCWFFFRLWTDLNL
ncbi:hypothetical protein MUU53_20170 [Rhizobium lemnae]|uniref:Uncharacterized protein n=1 Tax=Rhizobium lemnae TaxID=1214924 RepID=A0ABV8E5M5_9HYPH|nr:hypothetical protein [Rhizobium lemnae]MCJ8510206.1 hypothetical protein [Rhizobium lemnae]